jgi:hypothetical protein
MKFPYTFIILCIITAACEKGEMKAQVGAEKTCELHHKPLKNVSGYLPDLALMVSPGYGVTEFNTQFGAKYPHVAPWDFSSHQVEHWNRVTKIEECTECKLTHTRDFATYLKIDEKVRRNQYMEFLDKTRPSLNNDSNKDSGSNAADPENNTILDLPD